MVQYVLVDCYTNDVSTTFQVRRECTAVYAKLTGIFVTRYFMLVFGGRKYGCYQMLA